MRCSWLCNTVRLGRHLAENEIFCRKLDEVAHSIPRGERTVTGADFSGHVGVGNRGDEEAMAMFGIHTRERRRTDGGRLCKKDVNSCSESFLPKEAGAYGDLQEQRLKKKKKKTHKGGLRLVSCVHTSR